MFHPADFVARADEQAAVLRRLHETRADDVGAIDLERLAEDSGTLRAEVQPMLPRAWANGRKLAVKGLRIYGTDTAAVPADCPWTLAQILDDDFEPANRHGLP